MSRKSLIGKVFNKTPVPYKRAGSENIFTADKSPSDQAAQLEAYGSVSTLYAIVNMLSTSVAQAEWKLYRKAKPGQRPEDRTEVTTHPALTVWNKPNQFMTRQEFVQSIEQHLDLVGESYWFVATISGFGMNMPVELWPIRPDKCNPVEHDSKFIAGYVVRNPDGQWVPFQVDQIIQVLNPDPCDPYHGISPVKSLMTDLRATKMAAQYNENFFKNGAEPGGIIELPETVTDEEFDEMVTRWREQHQGVANAHRVAFLEAGTWKERKFSQKDMQFAELRNVNREIIQEAYSFPRALLGITEDVNKAVAEAAETQYYRFLVVPRLERIKEALNNDFLPLFFSDPRLVDVEFDFTNPVPDDRQADAEQLTARANAVKTLVDAGADLNDALEAVGLPPMERAIMPAKPISNPSQAPVEPSMQPEEVVPNG